MGASLSQSVGHCVQHASHTVIAVQYGSCFLIAQHVVLDLFLHLGTYFLVLDNL